MPSRIALDATYGAGDSLTGVGVYSREMLEGLARAHADARFRWCYRPHRFGRGFQQSRPSNAAAWPLFENWVPGCDLFHGLNQRLPLKRLRRAVATFHDLFVISSSAYSSPDFRERFRLQAQGAAERSDLLIAVSEFTARQINELLGVPRERIRVVPHGVRVPVVPIEQHRAPVILSLGALQTRKNTARLVEAFELLDAPDWRLVLAGGDGYGAAEIHERIARSSKRAQIQLPGFISDAERERLYAEASIFAFPSLDEGFGIPVLEAMARGVPVVTSTTSAMPEVAGDAALLADPLDAASIATVLQRLMDDTGLRVSLAARGRTRAAEFTWERAVAQTWAVYRELL